MKRIALTILWFGPWPAWMSLFLQSCRYNPSVDFILFADAEPPEDLPKNVRVISTTLDAYIESASKRLSLDLRWRNAYKLCDIRPTLGYLHEDLYKDYDFWGYGDIDVIFGDIRSIVTDDILERYDVVSSHDHVVSGHFVLIKNNDRMRTAFRKIRHWRYLLGAEKHKSFDERIFSLLFLDDEGRRKRGFHRFLAPKLGGAYLHEQFSTSIKGLPWVDGTQNYPKTWFWRNGHLTADTAPADREFLYVHFTHWASKRWSGTDRSVWADINPLVKVSDQRPTAFKIGAEGFSDL